MAWISAMDRSSCVHGVVGGGQGGPGWPVSHIWLVVRSIFVHNCARAVDGLGMEFIAIAIGSICRRLPTSIGLHGFSIGDVAWVLLAGSLCINAHWSDTRCSGGGHSAWLLLVVWCGCLLCIGCR